VTTRVDRLPVAGLCALAVAGFVTKPAQTTALLGAIANTLTM
jgi:hypothetical protein